MTTVRPPSFYACFPPFIQLIWRYRGTTRDMFPCKRRTSSRNHRPRMTSEPRLWLTLIIHLAGALATRLWQESSGSSSEAFGVQRSGSMALAVATTLAEICICAANAMQHAMEKVGPWMTGLRVSYCLAVAPLPTKTRWGLQLRFGFDKILQIRWHIARSPARRSGVFHLRGFPGPRARHHGL